MLDTQVFCEKLNESLAWKRDQPGRLGMGQTLSLPNKTNQIMADFNS